MILNDNGIVFDEVKHEYHIGNKQLEGITGTLVSWVYPDTYNGIPEYVLQAAADHGSEVHQAIEDVELLGANANIPETQQYIDIMQRHGLRCIKHECLVTDAVNFASAIDLVLLDDNNNVLLGDIKTTSALHRGKVALQLSIYRYLFEMCNPSTKVHGIGELWLPRPQYGSPAWIPLTMVDISTIEQLICEYLQGEKDGTHWQSCFECTNELIELPSQAAAIATELAELELQAKEIKQKQDNVRQALLQAMEQYNVKKWEHDKFIVSYVAPTTRQSLDSKAVKELAPEIYEQCLKASTTKASIRIKIK